MTDLIQTHPELITAGLAVVATCATCITYKLYCTQDGLLRYLLLGYFGSIAFWAGVSALWYHPAANNYGVVWVFGIPAFLMHLCLAGYISVYLGLGRRKKPRIFAE